MLQQTRVQAVIPYYDRFLGRFPNIQSLADAELEEVLQIWQGLGYYARARNLHQAAQIIIDQYTGQFPSTYNTVLKLPGIGKYTAAAILSISFNQPYPVVDGNVLRVMARLAYISSDIRLPKTLNTIEAEVSKIFPPNQASLFNQGMMELGALICIPRQPRCNECPLSNDCKAFKNGYQSKLPFISEKPKPIIVKRIIFLIRNDDKILIHLRKPKGLLASLWEFPGVESSLKAAAVKFQDEYGFPVKVGMKLFGAEHVFTHRHWKMIVYEGIIKKEIRTDESFFKWVYASELDMYPIPSAFKTIVKYCRTAF